jgi:hypothetical protein
MEKKLKQEDFGVTAVIVKRIRGKLVREQTQENYLKSGGQGVEGE